jgi:hypothetical protein
MNTDEIVIVWCESCSEIVCQMVRMSTGSFKWLFRPSPPLSYLVQVGVLVSWFESMVLPFYGTWSSFSFFCVLHCIASHTLVLRSCGGCLGLWALLFESAAGP